MPKSKSDLMRMMRESRLRAGFEQFTIWIRKEDKQKVVQATKKYIVDFKKEKNK